ncbi:hypothetical protein IWZ03DRAFT_358759 [Phyllosticta citriasiana]|uniref:Uncharacterized protein n=1 Tax=Phyllosticta citriasiana TaxID=595635 RepID=A0ABR1KTB2_9PEZI
MRGMLQEGLMEKDQKNGEAAKIVFVEKAKVKVNDKGDGVRRWFDESSEAPTYGRTLKRETAQDQVEVGDAKRFDGGRRRRGGRVYDETATGIVVVREDPVMMLLAYTPNVGKWFRDEDAWEAA